MLLPTTCPVCGDRGPAPCERCAAGLRRAPSLPAPQGVDSCGAFLAYVDEGRELVARLKYRNARSSVPFLARGMAAVAPPEVELVTWAPTTPARLRSRGFDQARLLARAVARELQIPCLPLLVRRPGPAQTGRDAAARHSGPAFTARRSLDGRRVLLVDDVVTTGATVASGARALRDAGAEAVHVVAAARTPARRGHVHSAMPALRRQLWK
ncbi:MAG: ComF family protein [Acidimicrobiales bacterium]